MKKYFGICFLFVFLISTASAQSDSSFKTNTVSIFVKISEEVKNFKLDTSSVPDDNITRKIQELRNLRGGFNINEAIDYKLEEDRQKNEIPKEEMDKFSDFFKNGEGKKWIDNSMIWIYRQHFTYKELKKLVKFYKTSEGQKMAIDFPVIMLKSLTAAEAIKDLYQQQNRK